MKSKKFQIAVSVLSIGLLLSTIPQAQAGKKHSRDLNVNRNVNVNRNANVNRNTNYNRNTNVKINQNIKVNENINVNRNVKVNNNYSRNVDVNYHYNNNNWGAAAVGAAVGVAAGVAIGAAIAAPPVGYRTVYYGDVPYAYANGVYYQPASSGYVVVQPPIGVVVPVLPNGASLTVVNGMSVYQFGGVYYQPVFVNGVTAYRTVQF